MSKIQEALRRIQNKGDQRAPEAQSTGATSQVAKLVVTQSLDVNGIEREDGRIVEVNRALLRDAGLLAPEDQVRHVADQYRLLKRPILDLAAGVLADRPEHANLVMVASALPGDGKTFNAINLALSMAVEKDTSVLLVDADVPKPHISDLFGLAGEPGLIDLLVDQSLSIGDVIIPSDVPGLSFLPAGRADEHATELLASRRMGKIAEQLATANPDRIVVFDSPPLLATSESRVLASRMGQIALVVCAGKTPQFAVESAIDSLDTDRPVNLILNQAASSFSEGLYGQYQYGYGDASRKASRPA